MYLRRASRLWLALMLSIAGFGAAAGAAGTAAKTSPLADAVQHRDKQAILTLLKTHADVNAPQSDGATALHWAAYLEDADTTALLIRAGANVKAANNYGVTPLTLAPWTVITLYASVECRERTLDGSPPSATG